MFVESTPFLISSWLAHSSCWQYRLLLTISQLCSNSWCKFPFVFQQMLSMIFLTNLWGFWVYCGTLSESHHLNLRWVLSNVIHFLSPVKIESKTSLSIDRIDWQVTIPRILWISVGLNGIHLLSVHTFSMSSNVFSRFDNLSFRSRVFFD